MYRRDTSGVTSAIFNQIAKVVNFSTSSTKHIRFFSLGEHPTVNLLVLLPTYPRWQVLPTCAISYWHIFDWDHLTGTFKDKTDDRGDGNPFRCECVKMFEKIKLLKSFLKYFSIHWYLESKCSAEPGAFRITSGWEYFNVFVEIWTRILVNYQVLTILIWLAVFACCIVALVEDEVMKTTLPIRDPTNNFEVTDTKQRWQ